MSRRTRDGALLSWRLAVPTDDAGGVIPLLIDWGGTPHPSLGLPGDVRLRSLRLAHPEPARLSAALAALGCPLEVVSGPEPSLVARLSTDREPLWLC